MGIITYAWWFQEPDPDHTRMLTAQLCGAKFCRWCHSLQRMTFSGKSAGRPELRKHSLFKNLSPETWSCREWAAFVSCFFFFTLAHTSLLISGGVIPASRYSSSTLVGLKHPVIDLHTSFSSGSSLCVVYVLFVAHGSVQGDT